MTIDRNSNAARRRMLQDTVSIREQLRATEALGDDLLFNSFELGKRMLTARRNPDVAPHIGQSALIRLVSAQQSIVAGANDLFRVHDELSKVGIAVGVMDEPGTTPPSGIAALEATGTEAADA